MEDGFVIRLAGVLNIEPGNDIRLFVGGHENRCRPALVPVTVDTQRVRTGVHSGQPYRCHSDSPTVEEDGGAFRIRSNRQCSEKYFGSLFDRAGLPSGQWLFPVRRRRFPIRSGLFTFRNDRLSG